ncbi:hypothetical protein BO85DRAFT_444399 [Aspergillus piperis CBS 112811]|uniref:Uncharacterized protein n=1 Tax=Aspergillus piperis CBS 112811 TaxID=1448313 RepID=A0A8G1RGU3_9EURO|nr:hypothetical protein BO85DRAFT_444399 [Aspergillus piperis CBS 112811]RAH63055.1 hypothetical protein BO85DRAFT_444399 [Aspergillus piperis CBS 112811]
MMGEGSTEGKYMRVTRERRRGEGEEERVDDGGGEYRRVMRERRRDEGEEESVMKEMRRKKKWDEGTDEMEEKMRWWKI